MPNLADSNLCVGCSACASICPKQCVEMKTDSYGFSYPILTYPTNCIECGMCEIVCPILNLNIDRQDLPSAYAAFTKDECIRLDSSSGGIFTEMAKRIIAKNGVVYGAAYDDKFAVYHCCVDNVDDLQKLRGAKYAESNLGNSFAEILDKLEQNQLVLFSGTPCQVAGLKSYVRKDFNNLICIDFVCHGIPSPMAWKAYIEYRSREDADGKLMRSVNLRSKGTGWSKYRYSNVFEYENGNVHSILSSQSLFMKLFVGDYISRRSCSACKFKGYSRVSDITVGDFWGIWDIFPEMDDNKGTSVVLLQSQKGKALWEEIDEMLIYKQVTLEEASRYNPSMVESSEVKENREEVLELIKRGKINNCSKIFIGRFPFFERKMKNTINKLIYKILRKY